MQESLAVFSDALFKQVMAEMKAITDELVAGVYAPEEVWNSVVQFFTLISKMPCFLKSWPIGVCDNGATIFKSLWIVLSWKKDSDMDIKNALHLWQATLGVSCWVVLFLFMRGPRA